ncbi:MAG TPA: hypothetical protein VHX90_03315 [Verrucomicrobiae bacterium]|jgi:hypothetical protein|nr:hypothetical protein [Verrucomicrobiae bacterium]
MKFFVFILLLAAVAGGCTTRSSANARARMAYLAGQNAALRQQQAAQFSGVTILGPVQTSQVPWVEGLTLAQAIATANYLDSQAPKQIIITRDGESATLDAKVLLNGTDIPLEIGDVIELRP